MSDEKMPTCVACDDKPAPENNPCAVCGASRQPTPTAEKADVVEALPPMPKPAILHSDHGFTAFADWQMEAYARAAIASMQSRPSEPAGEEPVAWVSPLQLNSIADRPQDTGGEYIPVRKSRAGQFTMALYTRPATPTYPERLVADPLGVEEIDLDLMRKREVQAMGAALSTRNWHDMEAAYNQLRDKVDRELGRRFRIAKASAAPLKEGIHDV